MSYNSDLKMNEWMNEWKRVVETVCWRPLVDKHSVYSRLVKSLSTIYQNILHLFPLNYQNNSPSKKINNQLN